MLVEMEHVKKHYKGFELDCSLNVEEGRVTGLIGRTARERVRRLNLYLA